MRTDFIAGFSKAKVWLLLLGFTRHSNDTGMAGTLTGPPPEEPTAASPWTHIWLVQVDLQTCTFNNIPLGPCVCQQLTLSVPSSVSPQGSLPETRLHVCMLMATTVAHTTGVCTAACVCKW